MASSKLLKERIESIQDTRKITNAMYLISSSIQLQTSLYQYLYQDTLFRVDYPLIRLLSHIYRH